MRIALLLTLLLHACGGAQIPMPREYEASGIRIIHETDGYDFEPESIHVFRQVMLQAWEAINVTYGEPTDPEVMLERVFDTTVYIVPNDQPILDPYGFPVYGAAGVYFVRENIIKVRRIGTRLCDSSFTHEIIQHRLPHVLSTGDDPNPEHLAKWALLSDAFEEVLCEIEDGWSH